MDLKLVPIHNNPEYLEDCCRLINDEWKRSETARMRSLQCSSDTLPTCLVLLQGGRVIGHAKLSSIPRLEDSCYLESVVIERNLRGKGYGSYLMKEVEKYCRRKLRLKTIHLSTKGQEGFYRKLGYEECQPISIYGGGNAVFINYIKNSVPVYCSENAPKPPPLPENNELLIQHHKTFMMKLL